MYPLAALLERGYTPVRFRGLAEDETIVSASAYQDTEAPGKSSNKASNKASKTASKKPHAAKR